MLPPRQDLILSDDLQETFINDGDASFRVGARLDRALLDPNTGGRRSASTATMLRTADGRLILEPARQPVYACRSCGRQPLSAQAVNSCTACRTITCMGCTDTVADVPYCLSCGAAERRSQRWRFLFSIS